MARRQADTRGRQQINERIGAGRYRFVHAIQNLFILVRPRDRQNVGVMFADIIRFGPKAAGDDDLAVLGQSLTNRIKAFGLGTVQKPAGIDNHRIGARVIGADCITFRAKAGKDTFAIHQSFGTTKRHHTDLRLAVARWLIDFGVWRNIGAQIGRVLGHRRAISRASANSYRVLNLLNRLLEQKFHVRAVKTDLFGHSIWLAHGFGQNNTTFDSGR
jgi:hypothetical protein